MICLYFQHHFNRRLGETCSKMVRMGCTSIVSPLCFCMIRKVQVFGYFILEYKCWWNFTGTAAAGKPHLCWYWFPASFAGGWSLHQSKLGDGENPCLALSLRIKLSMASASFFLFSISFISMKSTTWWYRQDHADEAAYNFFRSFRFVSQGILFLVIAYALVAAVNVYYVEELQCVL